MIGVFVTLVILVLLVTAVIGIFYTYDYYNKNMQEIATKFKIVDSRIDKGKNNLRQLVTNINSVNSNIGSNITNITSNINNTSTFFASLSNGLNNVMQFTSATNNNIPITQLPSSANVNMNLLSNVTAIGGMTINDLYYTTDTNKKQFMLSGRGSGSIVYPTDIAGTIGVTAPMAFSKGTNVGASISAVGANKGYIKTGSLGLGNSDAPTGSSPANPNASMHIMTTPTTASDAQVPFKVTVTTSGTSEDIFKVRKSGAILAKAIYLSPNVNSMTSSTDNDPATGVTKLTITPNGELVITPPPSVQNGATNTLYVNGNIKATGSVTGDGNFINSKITIPTITTYTNNDGFTSGPIPTTKKTSTPTPVDYMNGRFFPKQS